jgi:type IV secretion system protein TrbL
VVKRYVETENQRRNRTPRWNYRGHGRSNLLRRPRIRNGELCGSNREISRGVSPLPTTRKRAANHWGKTVVSQCERRLLAFTLSGMVLLISPAAHAQSANVLDQIVAQFQSRAAGWESTLQSFAVATFGILALIELAWAGIRLAFRGADMSEWLAEIVNQILFLGFFFALLENSVTWGHAIVNSFRQAASAAGGGGIAPSDVFASGVKIASVVLSQMSVWHPAASAGLMVAGIVIEVCFALIAAAMVLAVVESFLVISMGVLFMAFGGTQWTKDVAVSTVRYTISVGAKLFVLQLLVSIGMSFIQSWANSFTNLTDSSLCILIGCSIVMLALVKVLPDTMQRIVNGASMAHGSALIGAAAAVAGAAGAVGLGLAGGGAMAGNAFRLAAAQLGAKDDAGTSAASRIGRAAALTGYTAKNMVAAPMADIGRRLSGQLTARHGIPTWRIAADLDNRRRLIEEDRNKPTAPAENTIG